MKLDGGTRLSEDACYLNIRTRQSTGPGVHEIETPGFFPTETQDEYAFRANEPGHYNKTYRSANAVMQETKLQQAPLTQYKFNNQLYTRPYLGNFMGAGQPSLDKKDIESALFMKTEARVSKSNNMPGISIDRFEYLPLDPQELSHVAVPDTWIRGGDATRDYVRRQLQYKKCLH
jgi:hypothetical protein